MKKTSWFCAAFILLMATIGCCSHNAAAAPGSPNGQSAENSSNIVYQEWQDSKRDRKLPIKIYLPTTGTAPFPVVIFSHGLGGSREAAVYLGQYWSAHGYFCVFVQHPGSDQSVWQSSVGGGREAVMGLLKEAANGKNLIDRVQDVKFVLDELQRRDHEDPDFKGRLQMDKIGLAGHSFGAGTTLAIAGQKLAGHSVKDDRIKAAIYLCPPVTKNALAVRDTAYSDITVPGMLLTGTEDTSAIGETKAEDRRVPFDGMKSTHQYLINFVGADHSTFGGRSFRAAKDSDEKFHDMIDVVTTKFLDATLKDSTQARTWLDGGGAKSYLGQAAAFERK